MAQDAALSIDFYIKCAKPLILDIKNLQDRGLAAAWLRRIAEDTEPSVEFRLDFLKQFLLILQHGKLQPPFTAHPNTIDHLPEIGPFSMFVSRHKDRQVPYHLDFTADLKTFVAYQEIPRVGVHGYFAVSKNPIQAWNGYDKSLFPLDVQTGNMGVMYKKFAEESERLSEEVQQKNEEKLKAAVDVGETEDEEEGLAEEADTVVKKIRNDRDLSRLFIPLGRIRKGRDEGNDWKTPTWGSNLLYLKAHACEPAKHEEHV